MLPDVQPVSDDLIAEQVFFGLVDYGLFCEKLPPCFTSESLSQHVDEDMQGLLEEPEEKKLRKTLDQTSHDYIRYEALRDINVPRHLGIPHPESYIVQALALKKCWPELKQHFAKPAVRFSRIFARDVDGFRIFKMNYKGAERFAVEEADVEMQMGAQFVVKADISKCFPSIYTHSIPWALGDRGLGKTDRSLLRPGNLIDKCTQITRDSQTNGLLIGPHASNIVSELILTKVDHGIQKAGYEKVIRHIDDYEFWADDYAQAEAFLNLLGRLLREFELSLNEKKTRIIPAAESVDWHWRHDLNHFQFKEDTDKEVRYSDVRAFLDLAVSLARETGTSAVINYALQMIPRNLNSRAKRIFTQEAYNLVLSYPYLVTILQEHVIDKYSSSGDSRFCEFCRQLFALGLKKLYPESMIYAVYFALYYDSEIIFEEDSLVDAVMLNDCILNVLLQRLATKQSLTKLAQALRVRSDEIKKSKDARLVDSQWLFVYEMWSESELKGNKQQFLAHLKSSGYSFCNISVA